MKQFIITLSNPTADEFDRRMVDTHEEARDALIELTSELDDFRVGDFMLLVVEMVEEAA
jgi:hypothetical protein